MVVHAHFFVLEIYIGKHVAWNAESSWGGFHKLLLPNIDCTSIGIGTWLQVCILEVTTFRGSVQTCMDDSISFLMELYSTGSECRRCAVPKVFSPCHSTDFDHICAYASASAAVVHFRTLVTLTLTLTLTLT